jgi:uncharacterized membrane protein YfcA
MSSRTAIFIALSASVVYFVYGWFAALAHARKRYQESSLRPTLLEMATGFVTDFILEAFLYITLIEVDRNTLLLLIASSVIGAWWGAGIVTRLPRRAIQIGMDAALAVSIVFLVMAELHWFPAGGQKLSLRGVPLAAGMLGTCLFGALGTLGIGFYAPCMILVSLLGMAPLVAFPIMMGSSAFLLPVASARFLKRRCYEPRAALGLALGGLPGVLIAAFVVKSLPLGALRWLVVAVALWASVLLFRAAFFETRTGRSRESPSSP